MSAYADPKVAARETGHSPADPSIWLGSRVLVFSGRPGRIVEDLTIDIPVPRDPATRTSSQFTAYRQDLLQTVRGAMAETAASQP